MSTLDILDIILVTNLKSVHSQDKSDSCAPLLCLLEMLELTTTASHFALSQPGLRQYKELDTTYIK